MRFEELRAIAFGPFEEKVLRISPGMNVIFGPNESGKSTWHAVLYLGLCGIRRSKGQPRKEDKELQERHKPWDGSSWKTSVKVVLNSGRTVELRNDLAGLVKCDAIDVDLGRDCSSEIMNDGAPDGSKWLDLDRRSFVATACIRQGELLDVANSSELLQECLQRAAATVGTDATAAEALRALDTFWADEVGRDISTSSKPLPLARRRFAEAQHNIEQAQSDHREFEDVLVQADEAEKRGAAIRQHLDLLEARIAQIEARRLQGRLEEAEILTARFPEPSRASTDTDELAQEVAAALELWSERPMPEPLTGVSSDELRRELDELPELPTGDVEPHELLLELEERIRANAAAADSHQRIEPSPQSQSPDTLDRETLAQLADDLSIHVPSNDPALESSAERARRDGEARNKKVQQARIALAVAALTALAGIVLMVFGLTVLGVVVFGTGLLVAAWSMVTKAIEGSTVELGSTERSSEELRLAISRAEEQVTHTRSRAVELGLPTNPVALRELISRIDQQVALREHHSRWNIEMTRLQNEAEELSSKAAEILAVKGEPESGTILERIDLYKTACGQRLEQAQGARRRDDIQRSLEARLASETTHANAVEERARTEERLRDVAEHCRIVREDPEELERALHEWQQRRTAELEAQEKEREARQRLQSLLDGGTLDDLSDQATRAREAAEKQSIGLDSEQIAAVQLEDDLQTQLQNARRLCSESEIEASRLRGSAQERAAGLPSVAEAEEVFEQTKVELGRVERLDRTIRKTRQFLEAAQERTHRSIAPVLQETVEKWLPTVTSGRYADVMIDPDNLAVRVRAASGSIREAALLSHGTAEQIYLLLRVALAEHLARAEEPCPLLLDDVTVGSDSSRKRAILDTLKTLSTDRQVILFTQEEEVLEWAHQNLVDPHHQIQVLETVQVAS